MWEAFQAVAVLKVAFKELRPFIVLWAYHLKVKTLHHRGVSQESLKKDMGLTIGFKASSRQKIQVLYITSGDQSLLFPVFHHPSRQPMTLLIQRPIPFHTSRRPADERNASSTDRSILSSSPPACSIPDSPGCHPHVPPTTVHEAYRRSLRWGRYPN